MSYGFRDLLSPVEHRIASVALQILPWVEITQGETGSNAGLSLNGQDEIEWFVRKKQSKGRDAG